METSYSSEKGIQILISLLKAHNIKKIVTSPGGTNMMLNASLMYDGSFEMYSSVDERSAAYIACGLSEESGEPVMITCTGATASRNYMPGITEAYYRKLPILVVTGTQDLRRKGNLYDQVIDRSVYPVDTVKYSTYIPMIRDEKDAQNAELRINQAISALTQFGGGPSHINLETFYSRDLSIKSLPNTRIIRRIDVEGEFPDIPLGKIAIFIGSHKKISKELENAIDQFCLEHNAVVFCDHTSGYKGKFSQISALLNINGSSCLNGIRLLIHMGEISGDHFNMGNRAFEVWRVNEDGQFRDRYGKLTFVFCMSEITFFRHFTNGNISGDCDFLKECKKDYERLYKNIPELPFSNLWIAKTIHNKLPQPCCIHFGILTSLRSWNFFELPLGVNSMSNVGGFGTDGMLSSLIGASLVNPGKLYFGVVGDLAFFYDMNSLGNRHVGNNLRILLVNNGKGCEFTHHLNPGHIFKDDVNPYIAAAGHYGSQSRTLVRDYVQNLNFDYLSATTKAEFLSQIDQFLSPQIGKSCVFEVFTQDKDENEALYLMFPKGKVLKEHLKDMVGEKGVSFAKRILSKK